MSLTTGGEVGISVAIVCVVLVVWIVYRSRQSRGTRNENEPDLSYVPQYRANGNESYPLLPGTEDPAAYYAEQYRKFRTRSGRRLQTRE
jgi:hypothetical protein